MQENKEDNVVFYGSIALTLVLVVFGLLNNELFGRTMTYTFDWICKYFNW